ncbi:MAG: hypothetical protein A2W97_09780 [Bacteroidetes bacterium GWE2_40_63]|nr:MAG: hypothetical protein A2W84_12490 [Bacteroidetes bacterium GWC2_40_13]OFX88495.1 MAG: hypothetical protein A2W97_09780 [Bacteroidetes bacterium GWE2_40_63]
MINHLNQGLFCFKKGVLFIKPYLNLMENIMHTQAVLLSWLSFVKMVVIIVPCSVPETMNRFRSFNSAQILCYLVAP